MEHDQPVWFLCCHHHEEMTRQIRTDQPDPSLAEPVVDVVHRQMPSDGVEDVLTALAVLERGSANSDVKPI